MTSYQQLENSRKKEDCGDTTALSCQEANLSLKASGLLSSLLRFPQLHGVAEFQLTRDHRG